MDKLYKKLNISDFEYKIICEKLNREPNELEVYLFSAMWSEHCGYKHSKKYISTLPQNGAINPDENAGGIEIGEHIVCFKVESHNHPSAVEPFEGAATGVGGIIRDIIAVGARPIALLNSLKFGNLDKLRAKHLLDGVVRGISNYGNSIGVPTIGGETSFDESYTDSPLVNVMAVGFAQKDKIKKSAPPIGDLVVLLGSHTGRDGIHGASFASKELSDNPLKDRPSVQTGDPFMEKLLIEASLEILSLPEVSACQDCGAAGLLSSTSEMCYKGNCGMNLHLDNIHLREKDMEPWEIMLSESQERMVFTVNKSGIAKVEEIAKKYEIPYCIIGETIKEKKYNLIDNSELIASIPSSILSECPIYEINEAEPEYIRHYQNLKCSSSNNIQDSIKKIISNPNYASKKYIYSQYDYTVGNRTVLKPDKASSAGIWIPEEDKVIGLVLDSNEKMVFLDPYKGAANTVWECWRNLVSSGFEPIAITNCLNFGNPEKDDVSYQFVNTINGIKDTCNILKMPVVSGNVSFYNESQDYRVFPTPTIGMLGIINSYKEVTKKEFKVGESVFVIGNRINDESNVGGSLYQRVLYNFIGGKVEQSEHNIEIKLKNAIRMLKNNSILEGCIDISKGGVFGALFESLRAGNSGFNGNLIYGNDKEKALFGEIPGRYLFSTNNPKKTIDILNSLDVQYIQLGICQENVIEFNGFLFQTEELFPLYDNSIQTELER